MGKMNWRDLNLREKIGQTANLVCGTKDDIPEINDDPEGFLRRYPFGSIYLGAEIIKHAEEGGTEIKEKSLQMQRASRVPLLVAADLENGCGCQILGMTEMPMLMALGATRSKKLAYEYGKYTALEARSIGVNWTLAPVLDLNQNFLNYLVNTRSIGDDPKQAIPLLSEVIRGMQENGLAGTGKHFPGDGVDDRNQHHVTSYNSLPFPKWKKNHGAVFQKMIDQGIASIMVGHIGLPSHQRKRLDGRFPPATLSKELTTDLLKKKMGFKGIALSDAIIMAGFLKWPMERTQLEVESFKAGMDVMLWPTLEYFDAMEEAIRSGYVPMSRLEDAVARVWAVKERFGLFDENLLDYPKFTASQTADAQSVSQEVADKSITLLRDRNKILPLGKNKEIKKILISVPVAGDKTFETLNLFKEEIEKRNVQADLKPTGWITGFEKIYNNYDLIIYPVMTEGMDERHFSHGGMWTALCYGSEKSIVVSFDSPYVGVRNFEAAPAYINAYSKAPSSMKAVVKALFGEIPFKGKSPVKIPKNGWTVPREECKGHRV